MHELWPAGVPSCPRVVWPSLRLPGQPLWELWGEATQPPPGWSFSAAASLGRPAVTGERNGRSLASSGVRHARARAPRGASLAAALASVSWLLGLVA